MIPPGKKLFRLSVAEDLQKDYGMHSDGCLVPSSIPQMELSEQRLLSVTGIGRGNMPNTFPATVTPFTIPANSTATLLLDQGSLTNA